MSEQALTIYDTPLPTPQLAKDMMDDLQEIMHAVLDESDYAVISGKKHRKRSGFTKLRRAFHITIKLVDSEWEDLGDGEFGYRAVVRAAFPNGRYEDGDGYCDSIEMAKGRIAASRHNVRAKAMTRAKNRATADLLGTGEVSAEEIGPEEYPKQRRAARPQPKKTPPRKAVMDELQAAMDGRPLDAETIRATIRKKAGWPADGARMLGEPISEKQVGSVARLMNDATGYPDGEMQDKLRHDVYGYLCGVDSTGKLTKREASAIIAWLKTDEEGKWHIGPYAQAEMANIVKELRQQAGQQELELPY